MMRALLLSAGFGTRLRPLTDHMPKCMVPINAKPLLGYWLDMLLENDACERVLINTHYLPEPVHEFISNSIYRDRIETVHETELLGTGGTVLRNAKFFNEDSFMVVHADNLSRFNVFDFMVRHRSRPTGCIATMMTFETDQPQNSGIVELDEQGIVIGFHEKVPNPPGNLANGAVYIFEPEILNFLLGFNRPVIDLSTEVLPKFIGKIYTFHNSDYHRDIGTPESLRLAETEFKMDRP